MAYEVSRRSFLKGAAALAVATAASGLLTACGGGKGDSGFTIGKYKVYFDTPEYGTNNVQGNYLKTPMKIECLKTDYMDTARKFSDTFSVKISEKELPLTNGDEKIKNMKKGDKSSYVPCFTLNDSQWKEVNNGEVVYLTINLYGDKAVFEVSLKNQTIKYTVKG